MAFRIMLTPTRFPTNLLYIPVNNTPLHYLPSMWRPWGTRCSWTMPEHSSRCTRKALMGFVLRFCIVDVKGFIYWARDYHNEFSHFEPLTICSVGRHLTNCDMSQSMALPCIRCSYQKLTSSTFFLFWPFQLIFTTFWRKCTLATLLRRLY